MTVPVADTKHTNARDDYEAIRAEALALIDRIRVELDKPLGGESVSTLHWGHVGSLASYRRQLRDINDSMFTEGEYAEPLTGDALAAFHAKATR